MKTKLFCYQCDKTYEIDIENINYMQEHKNDAITVVGESYHFNDGCFFKTLNQLKLEEKKEHE